MPRTGGTAKEASLVTSASVQRHMLYTNTQENVTAKHVIHRPISVSRLKLCTYKKKQTLYFSLLKKFALNILNKTKEVLKEIKERSTNFIELSRRYRSISYPELSEVSINGGSDAKT